MVIQSHEWVLTATRGYQSVWLFVIEAGGLTDEPATSRASRCNYGLGDIYGRQKFGTECPVTLFPYFALVAIVTIWLVS